MWVFFYIFNLPENYIYLCVDLFFTLIIGMALLGEVIGQKYDNLLQITEKIDIIRKIHITISEYLSVVETL